MWKSLGATALALLLCAATPVDEGESQMTQIRLETIIREVGSDVVGGSGALEFTFKSVRMACISDVEHDRMRLVAPICRLSELSPDQAARVLEANFHTALDARYASSQGVLYAAFIHPLSPLANEELRSAIRQVASLAQSFGTTYSSGELVFSPGQSL